ncbi:MAG: hypothetical protein ACX93J_16070, partial [Flagellimonas marinaquae]
MQRKGPQWQKAIALTSREIINEYNSKSIRIFITYYCDFYGYRDDKKCAIVQAKMGAQNACTPKNHLPLVVMQSIGVKRRQDGRLKLFFLDGAIGQTKKG